jgi:hypothetical protein
MAGTDFFTPAKHLFSTLDAIEKKKLFWDPSSLCVFPHIGRTYGSKKRQARNNRMFYNLFLLFLFGQLFRPLQIASAPTCIHTQLVKHSFFLVPTAARSLFSIQAQLWLEIGRKCPHTTGAEKSSQLYTMAGKQPKSLWLSVRSRRVAPAVYPSPV